MFLILGLLLTSGCSNSLPLTPGPPPESAGSVPPGSGTTATPFQPNPADTPLPEATDPQAPEATAKSDLQSSVRIWIDSSLGASLPPNLALAESPESADAAISAHLPDPEHGYAQPISEMVFALVVPFPTLTDEVSARDWRQAWDGNGPPILLSADTGRVLADFMGRPSPATRILPQNELLEAAWDQRAAWAVVPFDQLEPGWKVLSIDSQSPLHNDFDIAAYPLRVPFFLSGDQALVDSLLALYGPESAQTLVPPSNRDPNRLTTVAMTGVTALVRATAFTMEQQGIRYPARDIAPWLQSADILHISNEVPFAADCPFPNPVQANVVFCSDPRYMDLLEFIGTDVVELTGDHFHDWGPQAMYDTLDLYRDAGWPVYGGGATFDQGKQAALLEHNGNRFAFIGCNGKGGGFAQAGTDTPGSVRCDFDWLEAEIERLSSQGVLVISSFQHFEYYSYTVPESMQSDFRRLAQAGAVIVSGSQAHHPHGFALLNGSLMHFGLGNLFFDQWGISLGTIQGFVDRHVFYDGRYISTELLTMIFEDYARPRLMTAVERQLLLRSVFAASGW